MDHVILCAPSAVLVHVLLWYHDHYSSVNGQQDSILHGIPEQQDKVFHTLHSNDIIDNFSSETGPVVQWLQCNTSP